MFRSPTHKSRYFDQCQTVLSRWREGGPQLLSVEGQEPQAGAEEAGGVYLFRNRNEILKYYPPNFFPPYNTPAKREIITQVLSNRWDAKERGFK